MKYGSRANRVRTFYVSVGAHVGANERTSSSDFCTLTQSESSTRTLDTTHQEQNAKRSATRCTQRAVPSMNIRSSLLLFASLNFVSFRAVAQDGTPSGAATQTRDPKVRSSAAADESAAASSNAALVQDGRATGPSIVNSAPDTTEPADGAAAPSKEDEKSQSDRSVETVSDDDTNGDEVEERESTRDGDEGRSTGGKGTIGRFRLMFQLRYKHTYVDSDETSSIPTVAHEQRGMLNKDDGYDIQRAFLRYTAKPSKHVEGKFLVDFAELRHENVRQSFKLAYLLIHPTKRLEIDVGLLKRTYSLLELLPIVEHELADLGPSDSFIKDSGYGGRDLGAVVRYQPLPQRSSMTVSVGAFRGDIDEGYDSHPLKLVTARIEGYPWKHLRLGVNGAWRPYDNVQMQKFKDADDETYYSQVVSLTQGAAVGADASLLFKRLQIRAEALYGDRTDPGRPYNANRFASAWLVVAPNFKLGAVKFVPAGKFEMLDANFQRPGGRRMVVTGVFGVVPVKNLRLLVDVTRTTVQRSTLAMSDVPWMSGDVFVAEPSSTTGTLQIQYLF